MLCRRPREFLLDLAHAKRAKFPFKAGGVPLGTRKLEFAPKNPHCLRAVSIRKEPRPPGARAVASPREARNFSSFIAFPQATTRFCPKKTAPQARGTDVGGCPGCSSHSRLYPTVFVRAPWEIISDKLPFIGLISLLGVARSKTVSDWPRAGRAPRARGGRAILRIAITTSENSNNVQNSHRLDAIASRRWL